MKSDIEVTGTVIEALRGGKFKVDIGGDNKLICTLSGRLRTNYIKVLVGDKVNVTISEYDLTKGIIQWRYK